MSQLSREFLDMSYIKIDIMTDHFGLFSKKAFLGPTSSIPQTDLKTDFDFYGGQLRFCKFA